MCLMFGRKITRDGIANLENMLNLVLSLPFLFKKKLAILIYKEISSNKLYLNYIIIQTEQIYCSFISHIFLYFINSISATNKIQCIFLSYHLSQYSIVFFFIYLFQYFLYINSLCIHKKKACEMFLEKSFF